VLRLDTPYTKKLVALHNALIGVKAVSAMAVLAFIALLGVTAYDIFSLHSEITDIAQKKKAADTQLSQTRTRAELLPGDIEKISDIVSLYKLFNKNPFEPLAFLKRLSGALHNLSTVDNFEWRIESPLSVTGHSDERKFTAEFRLKLTSPAETAEQKKLRWTAVIDNFKKAFSEFTVGSSVIPGQTSDTETFETKFSDSAQNKAASSKDETVTITVSGPNKNAGGAPPAGMRAGPP
jgi:hypothetical protein